MRAAVNAPQVVWVAVSGMDARQWIRPPTAASGGVDRRLGPADALLIGMGLARDSAASPFVMVLRSGTASQGRIVEEAVLMGARRSVPRLLRGPPWPGTRGRIAAWRH
jgi:hypothetical protein